MYEWILLLHILAAFVFTFIHGASTKVIFQLRKETDLVRMKALLELSGSQLGWLYASLLVMLAAGIGLTFLGNWWRSVWIWLSLALIVLSVPGMYGLASLPFNRLRKSLGMPYFEKNKSHPAGEPASDEEIAASLAGLRPWPTAIFGYGGLAVLLFLMIFKPF